MATTCYLVHVMKNWNSGFKVGDEVVVYRKTHGEETLSGPVLVEEVTHNGVVIVEGCSYSWAGQGCAYRDFWVDEGATLLHHGDPVERYLADKLARKGLIDTVLGADFAQIDSSDLELLIKFIADVGGLNRIFAKPTKKV
jgi:hypothetical protein